jgi:hypothetical protein
MATLFTIGEVVRLVGLISNQSLNGAIGSVVGDLDYESRGRYSVHLESPAAAVALHPSGISLNQKNLVKVIECARPGCNEVGSQGCSACLKVFYCSAECQKTDWKSHKIMCRLMKLMPDVLQPFSIVLSTVREIVNQTEAQVAKLGQQKYIRLLHHAARFTNRQFGKRVEGSSTYSRDDGSRLNIWEVEINLLFTIYDLFGYHTSPSNNIGTGNEIPYYQKCLSILGYWMNQFNLCEEQQTQVLSEDMRDNIFQKLSMTEYNLNISYKKLINFVRHFIIRSNQSFMQSG